jgi:hypothetical protein
MGDIGAGLTDMWRSVLLFLPKAIAFAAILVVGWFIAGAVRKLVDKVLERIGFDHAVQRGGIGRALERSRYDASDILARLAYYALLLLTLQLAFGVWGPNPISDLISGVVAWLPRAFVAIVIVVVAAAIASAVRDLVAGALGGLSYGRVLANLASWFIVGLGVIAALNQVGIATTVTTPVLIAVLATVAGILIVGVGGGLVRPMTQRWDRWLDRAEEESKVIRERAQSYAASRDEAARRQAERQPAQGADATVVITPATADAAPTGDYPSSAYDPDATASYRADDDTDPGTARPASADSSAGQPWHETTTEQAAYEPPAGTVTGGTQTYESGHAAGGSVDDTQRVDPPR